ncbi:head-tail connector protein [Eleftheria terrae]|uniref:head-tail connector protein n=1 Tax=Eleftheria terrae TaxID=1597781 RepID=UPI00263BAD97|nr:head-tail connector protein [Eleftheria terrae]WKB52307.1 phage gp6-like head-tail connector protein [Eleftheria terrae]
MPITTLEKVKVSARIDGDELDGQIRDVLIPAAQAAIEHHCGVAPGTFDRPPDAGAELCAIAICTHLHDNPTAGRDDLARFLNSHLLDQARTWT